MRDMVIKGTGNSRFLKSVENFLDLFPTYEAFATAFASGVLPVDFNGINPDGVTQMGTPFAKSEILTDETASLYGMDETAVPDHIFKKIISGLNMARIVNGSYVGTGDYGANNKNELSFSIQPKLLIVSGNEKMMITVYGTEFALLFRSATGTSSSVQINNVQWDDNTVQWWNDGSVFGAEFQMNVSEVQYHYIVIG